MIKVDTTVMRDDIYEIQWMFLESWKSWLNKENKEHDIPFDNKRTSGCLHYLRFRAEDQEIFTAKDTETDKIVGYIVFSKNWNNLHIDDLYVREEYRNKGIATQLLAEVYWRAVDWKCEYIHTDCDVDNKAVINLNRKYGFEHIGTLKTIGIKIVFFTDKK